MPIIRWQPINSAIAVRTSTGASSPVCRYHTRQATDTIAAIAFSRCPPGSLVAADVTFPASLPYAMTEPVKVTAPIQMPSVASTRRILISTCDFFAKSAAKPSSDFLLASSIANTLTSSKCALNPTKTAASPTRACMPATSSGICVISTFEASI